MCFEHFFLCVCVYLIVYIVPNTVLLFHGVALFFIVLFFLTSFYYVKGITYTSQYQMYEIIVVVIL